jgi:hypothetical protein
VRNRFKGVSWAGRQGWKEGDGQTWTGAGHSDEEPFPHEL